MATNHHHHYRQDSHHYPEFKHYPLTRVTALVGWAIHGFVFEFANGCRTGRVLSNGQQEMVLSDAAIESRRVANGRKWVDIAQGDEIARVTGYNLVNQHYLCHSITLHLRPSGKRIQFTSHNDGWRGTEFSFEVPSSRPGVLRDIRFSQGSVRGLDFVETTLHLPIQKQLVPTYPTKLQEFIRGLVGDEEESSSSSSTTTGVNIPEDVWFNRIFHVMIGAELMDKLNDDCSERDLVERMLSTTL